MCAVDNGNGDPRNSVRLGLERLLRRKTEEMAGNTFQTHVVNYYDT